MIDLRIETSNDVLITLVDAHAPYKGTWCLMRHTPAHRGSREGLEAVHTTYHPDHAPGCQIERLNLEGEDLARQFVRHLLLHNWQVHHACPSGESLCVGLPG